MGEFDELGPVVREDQSVHDDSKPAIQSSEPLETRGEPTTARSDVLQSGEAASDLNVIAEIETVAQSVRTVDLRGARSLEDYMGVFSPAEMSEAEKARSVGGSAVFNKVVDPLGNTYAFKSVRTDLGGEAQRMTLLRLHNEAKEMDSLVKGGSKFTPNDIRDFTNTEMKGIAVEYTPQSWKEAVAGMSALEILQSVPAMADGPIRLHSRGRIVLDIKPENYGGRANGEPVFQDIEWGRAGKIHRVSETVRVSGHADSKMQRTIDYAAPELLNGTWKENELHLTDVYSFAVTLHECLTGQLPKAYSRRLDEIDEIVEEIGEEKARKLSDFLRANMSEDVSKRAQSLQALANSVREIIGYDVVGTTESDELVGSQKQELLRLKSKDEARRERTLENISVGESETLRSERVYSAAFDILEEAGFATGISRYDSFERATKSEAVTRGRNNSILRPTGKEGMWELGDLIGEINYEHRDGENSVVTISVNGEDNVELAKRIAVELSDTTGEKVSVLLEDKNSSTARWSYSDNLKKQMKQERREQKQLERAENSGMLETLAHAGRSFVRGGVEVGKALAKGFYGLAHIPAACFIVPTMIRKGMETGKGEFVFLSCAGPIATSIATYGTFSEFKPELIGAVFAGQAATNLVSGVYESLRSSRKKVSEQKELELEKRLEETGMTAEEYTANVERYEGVLRDIPGHLSSFVTDKKYRSQGELAIAGVSEFEIRFGGGVKSEEDTYNFLIENGLAFDERTARETVNEISKGIKLFNKRGSHFYLTRSTKFEKLTRPNGEIGYKLVVWQQ